MIVMCAWCKKTLGEKGPYSNRETTHGICKPCSDKLKEKYGMSEALTSNDIEVLAKLLDKTGT